MLLLSLGVFLRRMKQIFPRHRYLPLSTCTSLHHRISTSVTDSYLSKYYDQINNQERVELLCIMERRRWALADIHMFSFPLRCASMWYLYTPSPLISWMASSKKTLLHFIACGRATGGNTNKFICTYPDYPPAVCFQLTHEITQFLETESSLLCTDHIAIGKQILLWLWEPIKSSGFCNLCWYVRVQRHFMCCRYAI
jgi:hypothetical protein